MYGESQVLAVASPSPGHAAAFSQQHAIPRHFTDYRHLLDLPEVDMVVLGLPNDLHCEAACRAADAGKHVVVEKPMAMNIAECDRMIAACDRAGVILGYAEELCFTPKYLRLKQLIDEGRSGKFTWSSNRRSTTDPTRDGFSTQSEAAAASRSTWAAMPSSFSAGCWGIPVPVPRRES